MNGLPTPLDWPWPFRAPMPPNEHEVPFAEVTWDRLEKGIWHHVRDLQRDGAMGAFDLLPDGHLLMHPADAEDFLLSEPSPRFIAGPYGYPTKPWGYELITTRHPDYARRGRPRLRLNDGTDVLL